MTILRSLAGHYERLVANGQAPSYGFSQEPISFCIVLSPQGDVVDIGDIRDTAGKSPRPALKSVPRPVNRSVNIVPNFLWDKTAYALGVTRDASTKEQRLADRGEHAAFKRMHLDLLGRIDDEGLEAVVAFLHAWKPERYEDLHHAPEMLGTNVVFRLDGDLDKYIHDRNASLQVWQAHLASQSQADALCLVTGERGPVQRLHPKIKRVRGAQSSGASVVSFNLDAFESFGRKQGHNAPVSDRAVFAYTSALNAMLASDSNRNLRIGDTTTVFWADAAAGNEAADAAEDFLSLLLDPPPTDNEESAEVGYKLTAVSQGRPLEEVHPNLHKDTRFFVLGLAPNAARLSVRYWCEDSIGTFARRIAEHWRDLKLEPPAWTSNPPTIHRLAHETAVVVERDGRRQKLFDTVPAVLAGNLMRAVLTGQRYPSALASAIIMRLRSDGHVSDLRVAILKAWVVRELRVRGQTTEEDYLVSLDSASSSVAYNLGRLFATFAYAERSLAERNATIRDKYMGAASSTPRRVFPVLMRGYEHNRAGLAKSPDRAGAGVVADRAVGEIMELLPGRDELPTSLAFEDQSRFFIGFYHQERAFYTKRPPSDDPKEHQPDNEEESA